MTGLGFEHRAPLKLPSFLPLCQISRRAIGRIAVSVLALALILAFFSPAVHSGLCGPRAEHPAHAHLRLDPRLRGESLQVLPAPHLHTNPAGALCCHPGQRPVSPALLQPQTLQDPEGLGEGWRRQVHAASGLRPGPEDKPCVRCLTQAPARHRQDSAQSLSGLLALIMQDSRITHGLVG